MINWVKKNKNLIIQNSFLLPILLVVIMSISHVVSWYDLGNPMSWAIYLSVSIEIFALASVAAATVKMNRGSIWFLFGLVTIIQVIGNIFFEYKEIRLDDPDFLSWIELISPFFEDWTPVDHRRLLAIFQGGTIPIMSLTALHYYIKFTDNLKDENPVKSEGSNGDQDDSEDSIDQSEEAIDVESISHDSDGDGVEDTVEYYIDEDEVADVIERDLDGDGTVDQLEIKTPAGEEIVEKIREEISNSTKKNKKMLFNPKYRRLIKK